MFFPFAPGRKEGRKKKKSYGEHLHQQMLQQVRQKLLLEQLEQEPS